MPYTHVPGGYAEEGGVGQSTITIDTHQLGDLVVLTDAAGGTTTWATGVSGGGCASWVQVGPRRTSATGALATVTMWMGVVTTVGTDLEITVTRAGPATPSQITVDQHSAGLGPTTVWSVDAADGGPGSASTTMAYPALTPSGADGLYVGYAVTNSSGYAGSTAGTVYNVDSYYEAVRCYRLAHSGAPTPTAGQSIAAQYLRIAALFTASLPGAQPSVDAGADAAVLLGATFSRTATEDNGGSAVTSRAWTIVAGPYSVGATIGTAAALSWTPPAIGVYKLRYTATNAAGSASDDIVVTVSPAAPAAITVTTSYDQRFGRVRVDASGIPAGAVRAVVRARPVTSSRWREVRGGRVAVTGGQLARSVDDYEFTAGQRMIYRVDVLSTPEATADVVVGTGQTERLVDVAEVWLKFLAAPYLNRRVHLVGWGPIRRRSRNARYDVPGTPEPIMVTDVHSAREVEIKLREPSVQAADALDEALSLGFAAYLHTPASLPLPTMYVTIGDYEYDRPAARSTVARFTIPLTEVQAPPPSVVGAVTSYQILLHQHATYADLLDVVATYQELL